MSGYVEHLAAVVKLTAFHGNWLHFLLQHSIHTFCIITYMACPGAVPSVISPGIKSIVIKVAVHPRGPRKHCVISLRTYSTRNPRVRLGTK